jgi:hypothetical protein
VIEHSPWRGLDEQEQCAEELALYLGGGRREWVARAGTGDISYDLFRIVPR